MSKEMVVKLKKIDRVKESNVLVMKIIKNPTDEVKEQLFKEFKEYINDCKMKSLGENKNHFFAIQCLIMFSELNMKNAFDLIIEFLQIDKKILEFELGNALSKALYKIIANLGDNKEKEIKEHIKNKKLDYDVRAIFSFALAKMTYMGKVSIEETKEFYKDIMMDENEDLEVRYFAAEDAERLGLLELKDLIKKIDIKFHDQLPWEYDEAILFPKQPSEVFEEKYYLTDFLYFYEAADELIDSNFGKQAGMNINKKVENPYDLDYQEPRSTLKIGRNDPCFCGSGKKYKKCCGK